MIAIPRSLARTFRAVLRRCLSPPGRGPSRPSSWPGPTARPSPSRRAAPTSPSATPPPIAGPAGTLAFRATRPGPGRGQDRRAGDAGRDRCRPGPGRLGRRRRSAGRGVRHRRSRHLPRAAPAAGAAVGDAGVVPGGAGRGVPGGGPGVHPVRADPRPAAGQGRAGGRHGRPPDAGAGRLPAPLARTACSCPGCPCSTSPAYLCPIRPAWPAPGTTSSSAPATGPSGWPWMPTAASRMLRAPCPRGNAASRLRLDPQDAAFLIATLPKLPGATTTTPR